MPVSALDDNRNPLLTAVSNVDDDTPVRLWADPTTHALIISGTISVDTTGLATSAKQDTIIGHLDGVEGLLTTIDADTGNIATSVASIDTKTPALGQALAAGSVPVVLTAAQISTLTPLATVAVTNAGITTIAGAVSGTEMQVDVLTMPTTNVNIISDYYDTGAGVVTANTGRMTLASNDPAVVSLQLIDNAVSGSGFNITQLNGVNVSMGNGASGTGVLRVTLANDSTGIVSLTTSTASIGKLAANSGVDIGDVDVTSISAGSNLIGDVSLQPRTANGCTIFRSLDLDETEEEIKATAGNIYGYYFYNKAATAMYLKFYNATAANVTVGTTTPVLTMGLPAGAAGHVGLPYAPSFGTAITAAVTTGIADNDTGAPAANDVSINVFFK